MNPRDETSRHWPDTNEGYRRIRVPSTANSTWSQTLLRIAESSRPASLARLARNISRTPTAAFDCPQLALYIEVDVPPASLSPRYAPRVISSSATLVLSVPALVTLSSGELSSRPSSRDSFRRSALPHPPFPFLVPERTRGPYIFHGPFRARSG